MLACTAKTDHRPKSLFNRHTRPVRTRTGSSARARAPPTCSSLPRPSSKRCMQETPAARDEQEIPGQAHGLPFSHEHPSVCLCERLAFCKMHYTGWHLLRAPAKTVVKSAVPRLICHTLQTHQELSRDHQHSTRDCTISRVEQWEWASLLYFDGSVGLITCKRRFVRQNGKTTE